MTEQTYDPDRTRIKIAQLLTTIVTLYEQLEGEAYEHHDDRDFPGGEALNYAGPVADLAIWQRRYDLSDQKTQDWMVEDTVKSDEHPLLVLASFEDDIRAMLNQPTDLTATVRRAADYIRNHLDDIVPEGAYLQIGRLVADLRKTRHTLEEVLKAGIRDDKGVPCMGCRSPLVKVWGEDEEHDRWHCPTCDEWSTHEQYMLVVRADYLVNAEWLTAEDLSTTWRIPLGTIKSWSSRGQIEKKINVDTGRMVYRVATAKRLRDESSSERMGA